MEFHHLHQLCSQWCFLRPTWLCTPGFISFPKFEKFQTLFFQVLFQCYSLSSLSVLLMACVLTLLLLSYKSLRCCLFLISILFWWFLTYGDFYWFVFRSLNLPSVVSTLLLSLYSKFFILIIAFFSSLIFICVFFEFLFLWLDFLFFMFPKICNYLLKHF